MAATVDAAQDMTSIDSEVAKVEKAIARVEEEIKDVDKRIVEAEAYLDSLMKSKSQLGFSKEDKLVEQRLDVQIQEYKDRLQHLRTNNQHLRTKKQQLRTEEQQLRTEKQQLRTKEPSAHANALDMERQRDQQQGSASTWSASRKPTVWWLGGWLSLWPVQDSQPLQQHLHGECDVAESVVPSSRPSSSGAASQRQSTCRHRRLHGAGRQQASAGTLATPSSS
ncbi:hypothetical protein CHLRE_07g339950v5 [Chlamydomonas reinhardtii]|uniref:Uncharacterized protein n=1 Tax=Chlamydomonas reinhardtii TaxID=3055 RepID=A0A2K3DKH6_CHLRE|nr:uncharacterized protein CHLRE_07g339950v5 [Chlamydomonas reinhardtii]PNW81035.1 hypothetical protein CHLRE_07g339950v5 [Chlamydomonas reinhardtii]